MKLGRKIELEWFWTWPWEEQGSGWKIKRTVLMGITFIDIGPLMITIDER